jgi:hypothetical protein
MLCYYPFIVQVSCLIYCCAECHYADCCYDDCCYAQSRNAVCCYVECRYAECCYIECHYAEYHFLKKYKTVRAFCLRQNEKF